MTLEQFYVAARAYFPGYMDTAILESIHVAGCRESRRRRNRKDCLAVNVAARKELNKVTPCVYCSVIEHSA